MNHLVVTDPPTAYELERFPTLKTLPTLPLADEAHVATWARYVEETKTRPVWDVLQEYLLPLHFPIAAGISQTTAYRQATRQGIPPACPRLSLAAPQRLHLFLYKSIAGRVPVLYTGERDDFVTLVRALAYKNEPCPIPPSMGACMVAGFTNWDRIHTFRAQWRQAHPSASNESWCDAYHLFLRQKEQYQDRFLILSAGPYSGSPIPGIPPARWTRLSFHIRLNHECAHYFTRRVLGVMRRHLVDELLADYAGLVLSTGRFDPRWFLRFMGLEHYPQYRQGGRLQNYVDAELLQEPAFSHICAQLVAAAQHVASFDRHIAIAVASRPQLAVSLALLTLATFNLAGLAAPRAPDSLARTFDHLYRPYSD